MLDTRKAYPLCKLVKFQNTIDYIYFEAANYKEDTSKLVLSRRDALSASGSSVSVLKLLTVFDEYRNINKASNKEYP